MYGFTYWMEAAEHQLGSDIDGEAVDGSGYSVFLILMGTESLSEQFVMMVMEIMQVTFEFMNILEVPGLS